jgi:hypothetical protein
MIIDVTSDMNIKVVRRMMMMMMMMMMMYE